MVAETILLLVMVFVTAVLAAYIGCRIALNDFHDAKLRAK